MPTKVGFFAWEASWGWILTLDQLKRRGRALETGAFFAKRGRKQLIIYSYTIQRPKCYGCHWVFPLIVRGTLLSWHGSFVGQKSLKAWMTAPLSSFWSIWHERNKIAFDDERFWVHRLKISFVFSLKSWSKVHITEKSEYLMDFQVWMGCK